MDWNNVLCCTVDHRPIFSSTGLGTMLNESSYVRSNGFQVAAHQTLILLLSCDTTHGMRQK